MASFLVDGETATIFGKTKSQVRSILESITVSDGLLDRKAFLSQTDFRDALYERKNIYAYVDYENIGKGYAPIKEEKGWPLDFCLF